MHHFHTRSALYTHISTNQSTGLPSNLLQATSRCVYLLVRRGGGGGGGGGGDGE